jgi:hypothetical protein
VRSLSILVAVVAVLGSTPAYAKGPAVTWRIDPENPAAREPVSVELRTWEWTLEGEPDISRPSTIGFFDKDVLRLPVRAYPASRFPHVGPGEVGISLAQMTRISPSAYRGSITFPRPGDWVLAWRGYHPGSPDRPDWLVLRVRVGTSAPPWLAMAVGTGGIALVALALIRRPSRRSGSVAPRA